MSPADIDELADQLQKLKRTAQEKDVPRFFYEDLVFHRLVWSYSGNRYAAVALDRAVGSLFACGLMRSGNEIPPYLDIEVQKHEQLLNAMRARQAGAAAEILTNIAEDFRAQVQHQRDPQS